MEYENIHPGVFIDRPNRFIAHVDMDGKIETVHVKNTGRCRELLLPGARVALQYVPGEKRKTNWDLIGVEKPGLGWVNIDSQVCNKVFAEYLQKHTDHAFRQEVKQGNSRFDFLINESIFCEIKGCTLEVDGVGYFPDAPTTRGCKHVQELTELAKSGREVWIVFVIAMNQVTECLPHGSTDPKFEAALREAMEAGVKVFDAPCLVDASTIVIRELRQKH